VSTQQSAAPGSGSERRIALIKPAAADTIVVHHSEPADNLVRWRDEGKHIIHWPDLGRVRANDAARTLNALASRALIETAQPATTAPKAIRAESRAPTPDGGLKQFLRNMRKHLRLRGTS
jgi:hypothetical protein